MKLPTPHNDRIIVEPIKGANKSPGGIFIPDSAQKKTNKGVVLAVGPGKKMTPAEVREMRSGPPHIPLTESDKQGRTPMTVNVNDTVYYGPYGGHEVEIEGKTLVILSEDEVLAVEPPNPKK